MHARARQRQKRFQIPNRRRPGKMAASTIARQSQAAPRPFFFRPKFSQNRFRWNGSRRACGTRPYAFRGFLPSDATGAQHSAVRPWHQVGPVPCWCVARRLSVTQICAMSDLQHRPDDMIHVRLPAELRAAVERVAQEENRTLSGQVRHIIARAIAQPQQPAGVQ